MQAGPPDPPPPFTSHRPALPCPAACVCLQRIKAANPGFGMGDIAKALGAEWKALTAEEKAPYDERAKADKARLVAGMVGL